jgi:hypothetical protein
MGGIVLIGASGWTWIVAIALLAIGGFFFLDKLMRKGVYEEDTEGLSRMNSAFSELQTTVDPAHHHVMEERERKRAEHDDAGDDPDPSKQCRIFPRCSGGFALRFASLLCTIPGYETLHRSSSTSYYRGKFCPIAPKRSGR